MRDPGYRGCAAYPGYAASKFGSARVTSTSHGCEVEVTRLLMLEPCMQ
jgi:hypothetical protein